MSIGIDTVHGNKKPLYFKKWKAKSKYNLVDVMLQCHVSNDAHRLNCYEMSGKRFHGLVTVY